MREMPGKIRRFWNALAVCLSLSLFLPSVGSSPVWAAEQTGGEAGVFREDTGNSNSKASDSGSEAIDLHRESSLTVFFGRDGAGFAGTEFRLYQVGEVSAAGNHTLTGDFANYPVSLEGLDSSGWRALAQTLEAYIARDDLSPLMSAQTGQDGLAAFHPLTPGLYLVEGDRFDQENSTYTPEPFLVSLPGMGAEEEQWIYDMSVSCKYDSIGNPPGGDDDDSDDDGGDDNDDDGGDDGGGNGGGSSTDEEPITRKVLKVWRDEGSEAQRPEEIFVELLQDGEVYETIALNAENNWRYTWTDLDSRSRWQVTEEDTPEDYTVSVSREGVTFVMTNTRRITTDIEDGPVPEGGFPGAPGMEIADMPVPRSGLLPGEKLPQTGMLWWPVPVLACTGMFLFLIGWGRSRHEEE